MLAARKRSATRNGVVSGSVWDSRMKVDERKGGIKVFNAEDQSSKFRRLKRNQSSGSGVCEKRKTGKSEIRKTKSESHRFQDESPKENGVSDKDQIETRKSTRSDSEACKDLGVCTEKINSSVENNADQINSPVIPVTGDDEGVVDGDQQEEDCDQGEEYYEEIEMVTEKDNFEVKEMNFPEQKPQKVENEGKKLDQIHGKPIPILSNVTKQPPLVVDRPATDPEFIKPPPSEFVRFSHTQNKLQNIVDLVMWKDVSKSALVFGLGTFILLSSSFTKDLNISVISATSYVGLFYLAAVFIYKSIVCRGAIDHIEESNQTCFVGEEEAIWILHLVLPYLNEFLLKLRRLFSGDPATTMKLAVMLFVLARCGGSIAIWNVAKLGFFGVFTLPKVCSSYSTQLSGYGKFWIRRFRDAWDTCSHKKAVAAAVFTLVWNLSSVTARVWAAFMLVVAFRYYQQSLKIREEEEDGVVGPTFVDSEKEKKGS